MTQRRLPLIRRHHITSTVGTGTRLSTIDRTVFLLSRHRTTLLRIPAVIISQVRVQVERSRCMSFHLSLDTPAVGNRGADRTMDSMMVSSYRALGSSHFCEDLLNDFSIVSHCSQSFVSMYITCKLTPIPRLHGLEACQPWRLPFRPSIRHASCGQHWVRSDNLPHDQPAWSIAIAVYAVCAASREPWRWATKLLRSIQSTV